MSNSDSKAVLAFRTHVWDAQIELLARRMLAAAPHARFIIIADETNGILETNSFEKLAHSSDFSDIGLPDYPVGNTLWYNGEYPLYRMRAAFPNATAYGMIEFDVSVTANLTPIFNAIESGHADLVAHDIHEVEPNWHFFHSIEPHFEIRMQAMIHALFVSPRAVDYMYQRRLNIANNVSAGLSDVVSWPFCEGFVPSAIKEMQDAQIEELRNFVKLPYYVFGTPLHLCDPRSSEPESIVHPVLSGKRFISKRMDFDDPADIFDQNSELSKQLQYYLPSEYVKGLFDGFNRKTRSRLPEFVRFALANGWLDTASFFNISIGCSSDQSSVSAYSRSTQTFEDARGGNNGNIGGGYGFWTAEELDPYWQVDLENICRIERVTIHNFLGARDQCTNLAILISSDQTNWSLVATKLDNAPFGGADGTPYHFDFPMPPRARYCRIQLVGHGALHLDEIEVFGLPD
ncbi:MAG: discoidin domain-containing protein [Acidiphilium sp.]|nr:discoidin domain-containing protein [Acidiphilium sp.]